MTDVPPDPPQPTPDASFEQQQARASDAVRQAYLKGVADGKAAAAGVGDQRRLNATMLRAISAAMEAVAANSTMPHAQQLLADTTTRFRSAADRIDPPPVAA